jgi:PAS domain S-box-containing protein
MVPTELKYKLLVDNIQDYAIFLLDPNGYIQSWNKGAQKTKGYTASEIIGKHFSVFYVERDVANGKPARELELAKRYGRVEDEDWRVRKDGTQFWANVVITALYDDNKKLVGFAKITRNLTERKRLEDEVRRANEVLKQQQRKLEALNNSKDEFVSLASHQLRTPASIIKQLLGIMLQGYMGHLEPEHYKVIQKAYASNERQLSIVNSLLKVAQLDGGKVILDKVPTDVPSFISEITDEQSEIFTEHEQTVHVKIDNTANQIIPIDQDNIRMAIENILDNASKYTPCGGSIEVAVDSVKKWLRIAIRDNGIGIAQEDMEKLFRRFSRIPNKLPGNRAGSGLGLYWAHKIIELHGGNIEVNSRPGRGSVFTILLPLRTDQIYAQNISG